MYYQNSLFDSRVIRFFDSIIKSGGIIFGGVVRDFFGAGSCTDFDPKDVDIFYPYQSPLSVKSNYRLFDYASVYNFKEMIREGCKESFGDEKPFRFNWLQGLRPKYDLIETSIQVIDLTYKPITLHLSRNEYSKCNKDILPTSNLDFLDFDINSLYIDYNGHIKSTLGEDNLLKVISNIKQHRCKLMRPNVPEERIRYMLNKGFRCSLVPFL
jgi:hypothetical protein